MPRHEDHQSGDPGSIHIRGLNPSDVALFRNLANEAAEQAVNKTFIAMGLDPNQPLVSQRYFQVLRDLAEKEHGEDDAADAAWARRWRVRTEGMFGKVAATVISVTVLGAIATFWTGFKVALYNPPPLPH